MSRRTVDESTEVHGRTVLVKNLTPNVNRYHLEEIFGTYGRVERVNVRPVAGRRVRQAFVKFAKEEHADQARLFMDGGQIDGVVVHVAVLPDRSRSRSRSNSSRSSSSSNSSRSSSRSRSHSKGRKRGRSSSSSRSSRSRSASSSASSR